MTIRSTIAVGLHAFDQEISDMQNAVLELLGAFGSSLLAIAFGGTNSGTALSGSSIMISDGSKIVQGAAGTTTTLLHGNAAGAPTYAAVSMTADVTGTLPIGNGGTGSATQNFVDLTTAQATIAGAKTFTSALTASSTLTCSTASAGLLTQETWSSPTLLNSWVNFDTSIYQAAGAFKDSEGVIHLRGLVKSGTPGAASVIFTLAAGYRPAKTCIFVVSSNSAFGECRVDTNGSVIAWQGSTTFFCLDGLTFDTR